MTQRIISRRQLRAALGLVTASALASIMPVQAQTASTPAAPERLGNQPGTSGSTGSTNLSGDTGAGASPAAGATNSATGAVLTPTDRGLAQELAQTNLSEIALGRLAQSRSTNEQVRAFAQRLVDEHSRSQAQLQQIAQAKGLQLPAQPNAVTQVLERRLSGLSGPAFDRMYMDHASLADERQLLSRIGSGATDSDIKMLANTSLPAVDSRLQMAETLRAATTSTGAGGAAGTTGTGTNMGTGPGTNTGSGTGTGTGTGTNPGTSPGTVR